ncbi:MAG: hypothetical protein ACKVQA_13040 [Burkholderiales bacterium]
MRFLIFMMLLGAVAPALGGRIYECVDAHGNPRFTNLEHEIKGCKVLGISPPSTQAQGKGPAVSAVEQLEWLSTAREDLDPSARLQAIEEWARGSQEGLDPVTHALLDPDESVRARAQELWEAALTRR